MGYTEADVTDEELEREQQIKKLLYDMDINDTEVVDLLVNVLLDALKTIDDDDANQSVLEIINDTLVPKFMPEDEKEQTS